MNSWRDFWALLFAWLCLGWSFVMALHIYKEGKKNAKTYGRPNQKRAEEDQICSFCGRAEVDCICAGT